MRRLTLALAAIAVTALAAAPIAAAHHSSAHERKVAHWEHRFHFKLTHANRNHDADHDGVTNAAECAHGTNPRHADNHTASAATVKSFTAATATAPAVLVITLPDGTTETGNVTDRTEIRCVTAPAPATTPTTPTAPAMTSRHHGDDNDNDQGDDNNGNDNSGQGSDNRGPGRGDDNGDDNDNDENAVPCTTADLTVGAVIHEAQLRIGSDGAVFREIVLVK